LSARLGGEGATERSYRYPRHSLRGPGVRTQGDGGSSMGAGPCLSADVAGIRAVAKRAMLEATMSLEMEQMADGHIVRKVVVMR